jgi:cyclic pyranopterin phosphate synthase
MVVIRGVNDDELEEFARMSLDRPFHVRFIEYMPVGMESRWDREKTVPSSEIMERLEKVGRLAPVAGSRLDGPSERFRFEGARGEVGVISAVSNHFCSTCNRLRLTADGKLRPCLLSDREVDIKKELREGADREELMEIIGKAIDLKPDGHRLDRESSHCRKNMSRIGG